MKARLALALPLTLNPNPEPNPERPHFTAVQAADVITAVKHGVLCVLCRTHQWTGMSGYYTSGCSPGSSEVF